MPCAPKSPLLRAQVAFMRACVFVIFAFVSYVAGANAQGVLGNSPDTYIPATAAQRAPPLVMLTMSKDQTLFFPAYNDLSDIDGDGIVDFRFKPTFTYKGLFNSHYCYTYTNLTGVSGNLFLASYGHGTNSANKRNTTNDGKPGPCNVVRLNPSKVPLLMSGYWSGNLLNYITTSRMDALQVALYGGRRTGESNNSFEYYTTLERAYIPQDGHAWAKEYTSEAVDGYKISEYAPITEPTTGLRHLFGNMTTTVNANVSNSWNGTNYADPGASCATLSDCTNYQATLRVIQNSNKRAWNWASSEQPVLNALGTPVINDSTQGYEQTTQIRDYGVRAVSCKVGFDLACTSYTYNSSKTTKPEGLLQLFGNSGLMYFGLLTGSYDNNLAGGRIRKNIRNFSEEVDAYGRFINVDNSLVKQINNIRIRNFNNNARVSTDINGTYKTGNFVYKNGSALANGPMADSDYGDWGNPVAEMMYEGLRYFANQGTTSAYNSATTEDTAVGLDNPTWVDPYSDSTWCAKPAQVVISSTDPSFDSDQLPGANFASTTPFTGTLNSLNVSTLANSIGQTEGINGKSLFVGESSSNGSTISDGAPSAKVVSGLGQIRGLAAVDTNKQGSYYAAAVAKYGKQGSLRQIGNNNTPSVDTYVLRMNDPFPPIDIPFSNGKKITVAPFAKTISATENGNVLIGSTKGAFQPSSSIVGMYIESLDDAKNASGNYHLVVRVIYDDREWGSNFARDVVVKYDIQAANNPEALTITVTPETQYTTAVLHMGYLVTGSNHDGPYLVARDEATGGAYFLDVPAGQWAGYCNDTANSGCNTLPSVGVTAVAKTFVPAGTPGTTTIKDPLWYAAQWGGYPDGSAPNGATTQTPSHYFKPASPADFSTALSSIFQSILDSNASSGGTTSQQLLGAAQLFTTSYNTSNFQGTLASSQFTVVAGDQIDTSSYTSKWNTNSTLTSANYLNRRVLYKNKTNSSLKDFTYSNLSADAALASSTGQPLSSFTIDYLLGGSEREVRNGSVYRNRNILMGAVINSAPFYSQDTGAVYINSNDGMLHAFDASNGAERFSYVPLVNIPSMGSTVLPGSTFREIADGNIAVSDRTKTGGLNYLVGFLGRGYRGLFGLQVNSTFTGVNTVSGNWELFSPVAGVTDNDMGYLLGNPLIEQLSDGTNVVIFGNGYNSTSHTAVLYVVRLVDGVLLKKFRTNNGSAESPNGLATPGLTRTAGKVNTVYAGDYLGNVWKFDLSGLTGTPAQADGTGVRMFTATDSTGVSQPITAPITVGYSYNSTDPAVANRYWLFFGTGSELTTADTTSANTQSIYGLIDDGNYPISKANLVQRSIDGTGAYADYRAGAVNVRSFSQPNTNDMLGRSGWYLNWSVPTGGSTGSSERVFGAASIRDGSPPVLVVSTNIRSTGGCSGTGVGYVNTMDAFHGGGLTQSYIDLKRNHDFADDKFSTAGGDKVIGSVDFSIGGISQTSFSGSNIIVQGSGTTTGGALSNLADAGTKKFTRASRRISWREIVK